MVDQNQDQEHIDRMQDLEVKNRIFQDCLLRASRLYAERTPEGDRLTFPDGAESLAMLVEGLRKWANAWKQAARKYHYEYEKTAEMLRAMTEEVGRQKRRAIAAEATNVEYYRSDLFRLMEHWSETCYSADWVIGTEYALWNVATGKTNDWGRYKFSTTEAIALRSSAERAGGWWMWDEGIGDTVFVPMKDWLKMVGINDE